MLAATRPLHRLTTDEAARRFGVPRITIIELIRRTPGLAERQQPGPGPAGFRWLIDPPQLGLLLAHRLDLAAAAARFGVPVETFAGHDPARLGMLFAVLPLPPRPRRRRPTPRPERMAEAGHAAR